MFSATCKGPHFDQKCDLAVAIPCHVWRRDADTMACHRIRTPVRLRFRASTFPYLTGLPSFPDPQTLRRFLLHAPDAFWQQMHRINNRLLQNFIHWPTRRSRLIFDLDSTVVTVFGKQEDAAVGYHPRYRGKKSYDPLLCLEANSSYLWRLALSCSGLSDRQGWPERVPVARMPNFAPAMPEPGMAAWRCWTPPSPMSHPTFASCAFEPMPALASILCLSLWKGYPHNMRSSLV